MIRVCPHSDSKCPNGMACSFSCATDDYDGTKRPASSTDSGEAGLREALARDRAYRDGLRAGFQMGDHGEAARYEAIRANLDREIADAAKAAREAGR